MVDKWGSSVHNYTTSGGAKKYIKIGATIVPYVYSDRIDFYLGVDLNADYAISDTSCPWSVSGNWSRGSSNVSGGVNIPSGGGSQSLWSEAVSSGHLYRVYGSPGQTLTATATASISGLFSFSNTATVTYSESARIPAVAPSGVTSISSSPYNGGISVSFGGPTYDGGSAISYYQYYYDGIGWTGVPSIPFNVPGTNGTARTVYVRAVNSDGIGGPAESTTSTPRTVPTAPGVSSTRNNGSISVSYSAPSSDGGNGISSYQYSLNNSTWTTTPSNPFNISGTNGTAITVYVRAVNDAGGGASASTTNTPGTVPTAPTSFTANTSTFGQIGLSWAAPSSNGGYAITGYKLYNGATLLQNSLSTSYTHTGLSPYADYSYTVVATNSLGDSTTTSLTAKTMGGIAKIWNGTSYVTTLPKVWNGTSWADAQARMWNGTEWKHGI
jgi:hypothetical protein